MITVFITLIIISLVLFGLSFFMNNRFDELDKQIEDLSISSMQEGYILKNKIKVLEEELLIDPYASYPNTTNKQIKGASSVQKEPAVVSQVRNLSEQGYSIESIVQKTGLREEDVRVIVEQNKKNEAFK
ncbi:hypothetical protein [Piscibacillus salipiscarius]|uniref:DUF2802 domain-containing protein n=2 Tax=Piscibacillus salipiscarius TaxID=299480 RepID=A0ABW5Q629_9BACI